MSEPHKVTFIPNPVQKAFIESRAKADLFSSRMGEGKSAALCWWTFQYTRHNPGASLLLIRDTWNNIEATTMKEFFDWFPDGVFGTYLGRNATFTWSDPAMGGGTVKFMGMDDPKDASKLQSMNLSGFGMDEPAPAAESGGISEMIFDVAMSRLRKKGMKWYSAKLAQNNSDESHWTYRRFVEPGSERFAAWQPNTPENQANLPPSYYEDLRATWSHRPDLVKRMVEGGYSFSQVGQKVTPEWSDQAHLATGLSIMKGIDLVMLWDFGLNPTCIVTQITPVGHWNIIKAFVGEEIGVYELIEDEVKPWIAIQQGKLKGLSWWHTGDPAGAQREQSSTLQSAVGVIKRELGGRWKAGPVKIHERVDPMRAVLRKMTHGRGVLQVDRRNAKQVHHALRGGWHYHVSKAGVTSGKPVKDIASHPGDALSYGAAVLFPLGQLQKKKARGKPKSASFFKQSRGLGFEKPGLKVPEDGQKMGAMR